MHVGYCTITGTGGVGLGEYQDKSTLTTTNATVTVIKTISSLSNGQVCHLQSFVVGLLSGGGVAASYRIQACYRKAGGTATLVSVSVEALEDSAAASWDATADASGGDMRIKVQGGTSDTVNWTCWSNLFVA